VFAKGNSRLIYHVMMAMIFAPSMTGIAADLPENMF
jgi:hypothetical protein